MTHIAQHLIGFSLQLYYIIRLDKYRFGYLKYMMLRNMEIPAFMSISRFQTS